LLSPVIDCMHREVWAIEEAQRAELEKL
jgi:hypothetical protein